MTVSTTDIFMFHTSIILVCCDGTQPYLMILIGD
jgi:hypothetical protein